MVTSFAEGSVRVSGVSSPETCFSIVKNGDVA